MSIQKHGEKVGQMLESTVLYGCTVSEVGEGVYVIKPVSEKVHILKRGVNMMKEEFKEWMEAIEKASKTQCTMPSIQLHQYFPPSKSMQNLEGGNLLDSIDAEDGCMEIKVQKEKIGEEATYTFDTTLHGESGDV